MSAIVMGFREAIKEEEEREKEQLNDWRWKNTKIQNIKIQNTKYKPSLYIKNIFYPDVRRKKMVTLCSVVNILSEQCRLVNMEQTP